MLQACDSKFSVGSYNAARRATGAVIAAVDAVLGGSARNAICIIRPPGHHAGRRGLIPASATHGGDSSGFCAHTDASRTFTRRSPPAR
jgi:acetoin utilization deacetylase AcuC-like enzyme